MGANKYTVLAHIGFRVIIQVFIVLVGRCDTTGEQLIRLKRPAHNFMQLIIIPAICFVGERPFNTTDYLNYVVEIERDFGDITLTNHVDGWSLNLMSKLSRK